MKSVKIFLLSFLLSCSSLAFAQSININTASIDALQNIKGIGARKAKAIVIYRKKHGAFKTKEDLIKVRGISHRILKKIASQIVLKK